MKYAVVTGVSKGLGASVAQQLMEEGIHILGVSRSDNQELKEIAKKNEVSYTHYACDLSSVEDLERVFTLIINHIRDNQPEGIYVVNNAGVVEPIDHVGALESGKVVQHVHVNLIAPMLITNLFYNKVSETPVTIVNITSGAANRSVYGWSVYGSTKAGLNYFTETAASEQEQRNGLHTSIAFSPGVMDTDMQEDIRSSSEDAFADVDKFKELKEKGMLRDTNVVAQALRKLLFKQSLENGQVYHVNDLLDE
ncbi:(S)-benzoin forming benzil reductase [Pontibacillus yanchengensis]|uniref:(S)-benzoin forming benzil reductase n=1 Tax=Pontibacillus yanchengensis TaxID=462910 RepID=A0A6I5A370_9BACI|nr:(S)-benzoin forming benzil reductase [Pontibacillus yanchengensis]MYL33631.1 (S)-benzoin forming benzil reductase [Pontibacillus yanchengensis]